MPTAADILATKGGVVHCIEPAATVLQAVHKMNQHKLGAMVVTDQGKLVGIFTERDVLRRVVGEQRDPATTAVRQVMTHEVMCCPPSADIEELGALMQQKRIRHVPVCDESGRLHGIISIGDVNAHHAGHQQARLSFLNDYVFGRS